MFEDRVDINNVIREALECLEQDREQDVIARVENALSIDPTSPEAVHVLGLLAVKLNEPLRAKELFIKAVELAPDKYEHAEALAIINAKLGILSESLFYGKLAAALSPYSFLQGLLPEWLGTFEENFLSIQEKPHYRAGKYHFDHAQYLQAIEYLQKAVGADPNDAEAWRLLSKSLRICDRAYEALLMQRSLDDIGLNNPDDLSEVALIMGDMGIFDESFSCHREVLRFVPDDARLFSNYIFSLNKSGLTEEIEKAECAWSALFLDPIFEFNYDHLLKTTKPKLRIGLVSGRFRSNSGLDHIWPLLLGHGQNKMIFNCYSYNSFDDIITRKIAGAVDVWSDMAKIDDRTAATIIFNDDIDILIDLDANLESSRPQIFAYNPAPVLLKYLGLPDTTPNVGYAGVFGGSESYDRKNTTGAVCEVPLAGLSSEIKKDILTPSILCDDTAPHIGLAPTGSELNSDFYEGLKCILNSIPNAKIVLNTRHLGGGGLLDGVEKELVRYDMQDRVQFSILDNDRYAAAADFVAQCDMLVVFNHMRSADFAWEFINSVKPVFAEKAFVPHLCEVQEVLMMLGLGDWCFDNKLDMISAVSDLFTDDNLNYHERAKQLCQHMKDRIGTGILREKGDALFASLAGFRIEYISSKVKITSEGET